MQRVISFLGMNLPAPPARPPGAGSIGPALPEPAAAVPPGEPCFVHHADGRLAEVVHPDGCREGFAYDGRGNLVRRRTASGRVLEYAYDPAGRLSSVAHDGERVARFEGVAGLRRMTSPDCVTEVRVDGAERPIRVVQAVAGTSLATEYVYDEAGRLSALRPPGSLQWLRFRHRDGAVDIEAEDGTPYAAASADGLRVRFANGVEEVRRADAAGRLLSVSVAGAKGPPVPDLGFTYDAAMRVVRVGRRGFEYAPDGSLAAFRDADGPATRYAYDARGNRVSACDGRGTARYAYDARGRLVALTRADGTRVAWGYDADGHLVRRTTAGRATTYERGADGRLLAVRENGRVMARYGYDALGRRVRRDGPGGTAVFHYDALHRLLAETGADGAVRATYLWLGLRCIARIEGPVGAPAVCFHTDHLGSVRGTSAPDGTLRWLGEPHPFGDNGPPLFTAKPRDPATGFYHFGTRDYDPEAGRFVTPDPFSCGPDDHRLLFGAGRDPWGERRAVPPGALPGAAAPLARHRYLLCGNDPVGQLDPMGNSAWWFFLTIPSSITWNLPNTVCALLVYVGNIIMEIVGWIVFPFMCIANRQCHTRHYPWGNLNPGNVFDPDERSHLWLGFDASARLGVPWTMMGGGFFVWDPYTMGNVVFIKNTNDNQNKTDTNSRFVVPKDPDTRLSRQDALRHHEMQHVFQYSMLGPLFHCLPIPLIIRIVHQAKGGTEKREWWDEMSLGGVTKLTAGGLLWLLSGGRVDWDDVRNWVNPATWWSRLGSSDPTRPPLWVRIVTRAWNLDSWMPFVGVYEWDLLINGGRTNSSLERNAGANSGDVYKTVVECAKASVWVGEFTRVFGADSPTPATVSFAISPGMTTPGGTIGSLPPPSPPVPSPYQINLNAGLTSPVQVVNGSGMYFQSLAAGTYTVTGTGSSSGATESVVIQASDVGVTFVAAVFVCQVQTISVNGDPAAAYSLRQTSNNSGGSLSGMVYTAGATPGTDTLDVLATYPAGAGVFATYGDNGLAATSYVVRTLTITVSDPSITPGSLDIFVGGVVGFPTNQRPQAGTTTTSVPGSVFDLRDLELHAGKGPIAAVATETVTLDYGCKQFPFTVTVRPITAVSDQAIVNGGGTAQITVTGGVAPYRFEVSVANSRGPTMSASGQYAAGSANALVTDTITVTDRNGNGGRARVDVQVRPMTATATPASVAVRTQSTIVVASGVAPLTFEITHRESTGSTVNAAGLYTAGTTPGLDTVRVSDSKGTQVSVTVNVTA